MCTHIPLYLLHCRTDSLIHELYTDTSFPYTHSVHVHTLYMYVFQLYMDLYIHCVHVHVYALDTRVHCAQFNSGHVVLALTVLLYISYSRTKTCDSDERSGQLAQQGK